jgi:hypothetical protein
MSESEHNELPDARLEESQHQSLAIGVELAALRLAGAALFDPVHCHYLQVLADRAASRQGQVKRLLDARLTHALQMFRLRYEQAQRDVQAAIVPMATKVPRASLGELVRSIAQQVPGPVDIAWAGGLNSASGSQPELKSIRYFRNTWSKLSVDKQLSKSLGQAPNNAGPINSHMLVLRSLALMREVSPDYLNRFVSYVDTLLSLEQSDQGKQAHAKKPPRVKPGKKGR